MSCVGRETHNFRFFWGSAVHFINFRSSQDCSISFHDFLCGAKRVLFLTEQKNGGIEFDIDFMFMRAN